MILLGKRCLCTPLLVLFSAFLRLLSDSSRHVAILVYPVLPAFLLPTSVYYTRLRETESVFMNLGVVGGPKTLSNSRGVVI